MPFFIPYNSQPNDLSAEQLSLSADSILSEYKRNRHDNYNELSEWVRKLYQVEVNPQFKLITVTVKVPPLEEGDVAEPVTSTDLINAGIALDDGNYKLAEKILSNIPGFEYQKIDKQLLGIEVSIPDVSNEQEAFIKLFYPHDPEIKLSNKEVETALTRFNSDDARLIAHYSGLLLKRESINNPDNHHLIADDWLAKIMQAKDPVDTNRIVSVWLMEYDFELDHKKLKNFKAFFENHAKYVVNVGDNNAFSKEELEKYHSETFKRRRNIIPPPFNKNLNKIKSIKNLIDYRYCSDGKGAYYIWKHEIPWYTKIWTWLKNWF